MKIGLLSDTHSFLDEKVFDYFEQVDEIWHAGDVGDQKVLKQLADFKQIRGVYGNIDDREIRYTFPEFLPFTIKGLNILMVHIGGKPGKYPAKVKKEIEAWKPGLFICGHSHILKVQYDPIFKDMLHINPGAAGRHGFHLVRTAIRFDIQEAKIQNLEVIELGKRGT